MLPSRRLISMVFAAAPIFLGGTFFEPLTGLGVVYVIFLLVYMVFDAVLLVRRRQITIEREIPERISLSVPVRIAFQVRNTSRRRLDIYLAEQLPVGLEAQPAQCSGTFDPRASGTLQYRLVARRRGRHLLNQLDVRILPRMGLFYRQYVVKMPAAVQVFPNLVDPKRYELMIRRGQPYEQGWARLRQVGQGSEFESLRYYLEGDDVSRIDWKATAKRSRVIVKNYEPQRQQNVLVALDLGRATAGEFQGVSRLDYLINATLMLAYVCLRQGDWFSLVAFSNRIENYLPPVRNLKSVERAARALYELEPRLVESDYDAACRFMGLKNRKRSLICLMTDIIDRQANADVLGYLARFARYHLPLLVTLTNPEIKMVADEPLSKCQDHYSKATALDVLAARQEALTAMRHQGVLVLDVEPKKLTLQLINRYLEIKTTRRL
ncbi:MAG: hypothetical protein AMJ79_08505 [Phycisphaerae bacterium SM23_30]|nr:MAG: hypothetical protein AMJ79_08505 [Phycisphaerae bacterium SM23_30]